VVAPPLRLWLWWSYPDFDMTRRVAGGGLLIDMRASVDSAPRVNIDVTRREGGEQASDYC